MKVNIGAFEIATPLGFTLEENWEKIKQGYSGLKSKKYGRDQTAFIGELPEETSFIDTIEKTFQKTLDRLKDGNLGKVQLILSTTKGAVVDWEDYENHRLYNVEERLEKYFNFNNKAITISNACISGLQAVEIAKLGIENGDWDSAIIVAFDEVSRFVLEGFACFHALSESICKPFDENRDGINIGTAVACAVVTNKSLKTPTLEVVHTANFNDANHISGPSRTGEGLKRAIESCLNEASNPNFISLHGTGTPFNDEMEAIALGRLNLNTIPVHSLKPYFGHSLGAAGLLELAICSKMIQEDTLIPSLNYEEQGTSIALNVQTKVQEKRCRSVLKTTSGFGGNNCAILLRK